MEDISKKGVLIGDEVLTSILQHYLGDRFIPGNILDISSTCVGRYSEDIKKYGNMYMWIHRCMHYVAAVVTYRPEDNSIKINIFDSLERKQEDYISKVQAISDIFDMDIRYRYNVSDELQHEMECGLCVINTLLEIAASHDHVKYKFDFYTRSSLKAAYETLKYPDRYSVLGIYRSKVIALSNTPLTKTDKDNFILHKCPNGKYTYNDITYNIYALSYVHAKAWVRNIIYKEYYTNVEYNYDDDPSNLPEIDPIEYIDISDKVA